jgi:YegS/Rv2252/BmrU family lipid kinase
MQKAYIVYNPAAGRLPVGPFVYRAAEILRNAGWQMRIFPTRNGKHAEELAREAAGNMDAVFAIGGDGTIGQVAAGLAGSTTALGILPAGTHNVLAAELGMRPLDWNRWWALDENMRQLIDAPVYNVDVGLCNGKPFLLWAGLGLDAMAVQQLEPRVRFDKYWSVPQSAALTIWNATFWHGTDLKAYADGKLLEGHYMLIVVTNIRRYLGGLMQISPDARLDDGEMDLWLFSGNNLGDALRHALGMFSGTHMLADDAICVPFRHLRLEAASPVSLQMDGEPQGLKQDLEFSIMPRALKMMIPQRSAFLLTHRATPKDKIKVNHEI